MPQQEEFESVINNTIDKLIDTSTVIQLRMGVKLAEENRISEAFTLLAEGPPPESSKGAKQRVVYLEFLQRVQKVVGHSMVVLCAVGLGPSAVSAMRDRVRVGLPHAMKEREYAFKRDILNGLANTYSKKCELSILSSPYN